VPVSRVGEAYGYDQYGADGFPFGAFKEAYNDAYGYGYGFGCELKFGYGYSGDPYGYGADDNDDTYGADRLPGVLHIFQLPVIPNGRHSLRVVVRSTSGLESEATEYFIVDSEPPVVTIASPPNDTINPVIEIPVLQYTIEDFSGVLSADVIIDGVDYGWLPSGTLLDFLKSGLHILTIVAHDIATHGCPEGNISSTTIRFNLLKPIEVKVGDAFYLGTDALTQTRPVDGIIEEFRVLNRLSTEANVLDEFRLLREKIGCQLRKGAAIISPSEAFTLQNLGLRSERINLPEQTLVLCHYDNNVRSLSGIDNRDENGVGVNLSNPENQIIDELAAGRRVDVTVKFNEGQFIDRELIRELVHRVVPAFAEVSIVFEEVPIRV
jgi:hypothetical protein